MTIGERIRELREAAGMSRTILARRAGVSEPVIWNWERKGRTPRSGTLSKVAEVLGVNESFFQSPNIDGREAHPVHRTGCGGPATTIGAVLAEARIKIAQIAGLPEESVMISVEIRSGSRDN